jgi:hypothetical protein
MPATKDSRSRFSAEARVGHPGKEKRKGPGAARSPRLFRVDPRKIVTHSDYTLYNPKHHPYFDQESGRIVYFEGTYADTFSGAKFPTPRYNYNQVMYRLDLADERLPLPESLLKNLNYNKRLKPR